MGYILQSIVYILLLLHKLFDNIRTMCNGVENPLFWLTWGRDCVCMCVLCGCPHRGGGGLFPVGEERLLLSAINSVCMRITSCNSEVAKIHLIKHYSV